jgi:hypothetical protein
MQRVPLRCGAPGTAQHGADLWTPPAEYRGFVARALFYMVGGGCTNSAKRRLAGFNT